MLFFIKKLYVKYNWQLKLITLNLLCGQINSIITFMSFKDQAMDPLQKCVVYGAVSIKDRLY
jgi:hypothetical protein